MIAFLRGAIAMACLVAGLFFVRFWRDSRERLMLVLGAAFFILGLSWTLLARGGLDDEGNAYVFVLRALAFGLIAVGVLDKNRRPS